MYIYNINVCVYVCVRACVCERSVNITKMNRARYSIIKGIKILHLISQLSVSYM